MNKFYIEFLGCQQNEYDAMKLSVKLQSFGFCEVKNPKESEFIFILVCSVRQMAIDRIFGRVRNWRDKKIYITGCVLESDRKKFEQRGVKYFELEKADELIKELSIDLVLELPASYKLTARSSAYVPIMSGCNNFCSYCVVPYTRGREKSRPMDEIILEVKKLISLGKKEITLLGQNVNSYKTMSPPVIPDQIGDPQKVISTKLLVDSRLRGNDAKQSDFAILLEKINDLDGDFMISFVSNHPKDMTDDIIEAIANLPKIKKEVHLPLQSGSDKILKLMNRPYNSKKYLSLAKKLTAYNLKLTTDIIVGFPGETEDDFQKTVTLCKKIGFCLAYVNKYSPRNGTASFKLGDPIEWKKKQRRWKILNELINKKQKST